MIRLYNLFRYLLFVFLLLWSILIVLTIVFINNNIVELIIIGVFSIISLFFLLLFYILALRILQKGNTSVNNNIMLNFENSLNFASVGLVLYDEDGSIVYMNEYLSKLSDKNLVGMRLTSWIPDLSILLNNPSQKINITYKDNNFQVRIHAVTRTLIFRDVSQYQSLLWKTTSESPVLGILSIDNLLHTLNSVNDNSAIEISNTVRSLISDWAKKYNIFLRSYSDTNYLILLHQDDYLGIVQNNFSILEEVKKTVLKDFVVDVTLSIGLAYGTTNFIELYDLALASLELAEARGGDQAVVRNYFYPNYTFFGKQKPGQRETSQVKIRKFARRLQQLIKAADKVIISGHKFADYDCIASSLCFYFLALSCNKEVKIALDFDHLDKNAMNNISDLIPADFAEKGYIALNKVQSYVTPQTLLIVADTHVPSRVEVSNVLNTVGSIVVIDHHIRNPIQIEKYTDLFIEPSASSTSEIAVEIIRYQDANVHIPKWLSTLMLTGIMMDTNFYRMRTGQRTFAASAFLQDIGADFIKAQNLLKDTAAEQKLKFSVLKNIIKIKDKVMFVKAPADLKVERSVLAQIAQELVQVQDIHVGIAIAIDSSGIPCMSARSNGLANVIDFTQNLKGGGHFDAAATQAPEMSYDNFCTWVESTIKEWDFKIENITD